jgi:hypothetical protein
MIGAKPENLIGDRAYGSDPLDAELRKDGIEMIAPHRSNRSKPPSGRAGASRDGCKGGNRSTARESSIRAGA